MIDTEDLVERHRKRFGAQPSLFAAPGRVNLIGEHTDYNDGFVLPMAIDRHTVVAVSPGDAPSLSIYSESFGESAVVALDEPFARRNAWIDYIAGVAAAVGEETPLHTGGSLTIAGDLPVGSGLSSSAAVELSVAQALFSLARTHADPRRLASIGSRAEHEFVGIRSGVMDQLICALGEPGCALLIDCRSHETTAVALPADAVIAVCDTHVRHTLASSEYNTRREQCERSVKLLRDGIPDLTSLRDLDVEAFDRVADRLPHPLRGRARHVVEENRRTLQAVDAIAASDLQRLGTLMNESHRSLRDLYEVSCEELDEVVFAAQRVDGVYGARMTGGGFGGAAIALLEPSAFEALRTRLNRAYYAPRGLEPDVYLVRPSGGAAPL